MDYFKHFPSIQYGEEETVNLLVRLKLREYIKNNIFLYHEHELTDYERPDILSHQYYGNFKYTWLILYANDIFDPVRDWYKSYGDFYNYINFKYQEAIWEPSKPYQLGMKLMIGPTLKRCTVSHFSTDPIPGYYLNSNTFKRESGTWDSGFLVNDYALFFNRANQQEQQWLKILSNNGVVITVDGTLPRGTDSISPPDPSKWEIFNNGNPRPGFQVAHQTIHEYRDSNNLVVDFQSWYNDVFLDITNEAGYYNYDMLTKLQGGNRQIVQIVDKDGVLFFIEMHVEYNPETGLFDKIYYTQEDITSHLTATDKRDGLIQDFVVRTKNDFDPPEWFKVEHEKTSLGWVNKLTGEVVIQPGQVGKRTITKYQYELELNEKKRKIKLIDRSYLSQILNEFKTLLGSPF